MLTLKQDDLVGLLKKYIDVFSVLYVPEQNWLTTREKEYFIANVLLNHLGIDLSSRQASKCLEDKFGFINRGVSIYRSKLKSKGWIIQTKVGIELPKAFNYADIDIPKELTFSFAVKLEEKDGQELGEYSEQGG